MAKKEDLEVEKTVNIPSEYKPISMWGYLDMKFCFLFLVLDLLCFVYFHLVEHLM